MPVTIEKMHETGMFIEKIFYAKVKKMSKAKELRGVFSDIGKQLREKGKTSVDLVRELREV